MNMDAATTLCPASSSWGHWGGVAITLVKACDTGSRLVYIANPGNAGDALIASATWQFFDQIGVKPVAATSRDIRAGDVVIYGGGGNLVPMYADTRNAIETAAQLGVSAFVLLPHTVRGHESLLSVLDDRFTIFCRDHESFSHVSQSARGLRVGLAPDMALGLNVELLRQRVSKLSSGWKWRSLGVSRRRWRRYSRWLKATDSLQPDEAQRLEVMRSDVEAARVPGAPERDLSDLYGSALSCRDECDVISERFLSVIDRAQTVFTDRLHVAVGAQLLGKPVTLLNNSYGKNHAVVGAFQSIAPLISLADADGSVVSHSGS